MSHVEEPQYIVVKSIGNIEVREYSQMILAEVEVSGERKQAIRQGFKILADYIFGNNSPKKKVETTGPVTNQASEKIAMTAPVMQEKHTGSWKVRFAMPAQYTLDSLPKPNSKEISFVSTPVRRFAVIRFSGLATDRGIKKYTEKLQGYITTERLKVLGEPVLAFYNPPWTLPFLRRNEVMIQVD